MRLSIPQYAQALLDLEKGMGADTAQVTGEHFFTWLTRRGEGKKMIKIVKEAERMVRAESGNALVTITTAHEADKATEAILRTQAEKVFAGQTVEARFVADASVIGGVKMRSDGLLYDATLATSVRKLRTALSR